LDLEIASHLHRESRSLPEQSLAQRFLLTPGANNLLVLMHFPHKQASASKLMKMIKNDENWWKLSDICWTSSIRNIVLFCAATHEIRTPKNTGREKNNGAVADTCRALTSNPNCNGNHIFRICSRNRLKLMKIDEIDEFSSISNVLNFHQFSAVFGR